MFGAISFAKVAGRKLKGMFKGKRDKEVLEKEVNDMGLDADGVDIHVDDDGKVTISGNAVSQEMKEKRQGGEDREREKNRSSSALLRELPGRARYYIWSGQIIEGETRQLGHTQLPFRT